MKNEEKIFMSFLLLIVLVMVVVGFSYGSGSRTLPVVSGIFSAALVGFMVAMMFFPGLAAWYQKFEKKAVVSTKDLSREEKKRERSVVLWFSGCTAIVYVLGFLIGIPLFLFFFLKLWARESLFLSVTIAAVVVAVVYFVFVYILNVPLHEGIVFS
jgi:hypothetical protein